MGTPLTHAYSPDKLEPMLFIRAPVLNRFPPAFLGSARYSRLLTVVMSPKEYINYNNQILSSAGFVWNVLRVCSFRNCPKPHV